LCERRNFPGTDAALIFHSEEELDQALYYMIGNSIIRIIVLNTLDEKNIKGLFDMRPTPSFHALFGGTAQVFNSFQMVSQILNFIGDPYYLSYRLVYKRLE